MSEQIIIRGLGTLEEGETKVIFETDKAMIIDQLTWVVSGNTHVAHGTNGAQIGMSIDGVYHNIINSIGNSLSTPSHIRDRNAPQWNVIKYDENENEYAFDFSKTPFHTVGKLKIEMINGDGNSADYNIRLIGREG